MKKITTFILLTLIASYATAQSNESKKTDRLEAFSPRSTRYGYNYVKECIETFRYEGDLEGKKWLTGFYDPGVPKGIPQEERDSIRNAYYEELWAKQDSLPEHDKMFIVRAAEEGPIALTYNEKDTTLVLLKCDEEWPILGQNKVRSFKMKVGVAEYDSIQRLHMLAAYTAVPMDPTPSNKLIDVVIVRSPNNPFPVMPGPFSFDTMHFYFVWGDSMRDLCAQSHTCLSPTAQKLIKTFYDICRTVCHQEHEELHSLMPAVHELLAHYPTLLLPDIIYDEWTDERFR
ncbi:MAG: hypothetical protein J5616_04550 [Bacteroidaceae bacterium]|nr:hypothetical protein [Bacteroidaceae bacterium]